MRITILVTAGPAEGQSFSFDEPDRFLFGRAADARISLPDDPFVSRQHFLLEISPPDCKVTDLESKNGLFVNGVRYGGRKPPGPSVQQAPDGARETSLIDGDEISVGETHMKVVIELDAMCVDCSKEIPNNKREELRFVGGTYLCADCRHQKTATHHPEPRKVIVRCTRCNRDVTREAGARGQVAGVQYVCKACREKKDDPKNLLNRLLREAGKRKTMVGAPVLEGYQIEKELGRGGMGVVYKAIEIESGRPVAIKTMLPTVAAGERATRMFLREVDVTRQLEHENVVRVLDHGKAGATFFFVLEFVDGMDLFRFLRTKRHRLSLEEAAPIMLGVLDGLGYAHRAELEVKIQRGSNEQVIKPEMIMGVTGVVHRDLKPQNVLLAKDGDAWIPKVADFGLSKSFESAGLTDMTGVGQVGGTPIYWPREQIIHYRYLSPATDVFSIAAVFYEMLTGKRMRDGFEEMFMGCRRQGRQPTIPDFLRLFASNPAQPIRDRDSSIPQPVAKVIDRALQEAEVPADENRMRKSLAKLRYADAAEFGSALDDALRKARVID